MALSFKSIALAGLLFAAAPASAQPFEISWYTIDGGGGTSTGGSFTLSGTIGQPDAAQGLAGGTFTLDSGFWAGIVQPPPQCPADLNNDGFVDSGDISAFVALFLAGDLSADLNNDGFVDSGDISAFVAFFLAGC